MCSRPNKRAAAQEMCKAPQDSQARVFATCAKVRWIGFVFPRGQIERARHPVPEFASGDLY
jgi:hypothetical protein